MNWVGGARQRIKIKNEKKIQREFFERQRKLQKVETIQKKNESKENKTAISQDLLFLYPIKSKFMSGNGLGSTNQVNYVDLSKPRKHQVYQNARLGKGSQNDQSTSLLEFNTPRDDTSRQLGRDSMRQSKNRSTETPLPKSVIERHIEMTIAKSKNLKCQPMPIQGMKRKCKEIEGNNQVKQIHDNVDVRHDETRCIGMHHGGSAGSVNNRSVGGIEHMYHHSSRDSIPPRSTAGQDNRHCAGQMLKDDTKRLDTSHLFVKNKTFFPAKSSSLLEMHGSTTVSRYAMQDLSRHDNIIDGPRFSTPNHKKPSRKEYDGGPSYSTAANQWPCFNHASTTPARDVKNDSNIGKQIKNDFATDSYFNLFQAIPTAGRPSKIKQEEVEYEDGAKALHQSHHSAHYVSNMSAKKYEPLVDSSRYVSASDRYNAEACISIKRYRAQMQDEMASPAQQARKVSKEVGEIDASPAAYTPFGGRQVLQDPLNLTIPQCLAEASGNESSAQFSLHENAIEDGCHYSATEHATDGNEGMLSSYDRAKQDSVMHESFKQFAEDDSEEEKMRQEIYKIKHVYSGPIDVFANKQPFKDLHSSEASLVDKEMNMKRAASNTEDAASPENNQVCGRTNSPKHGKQHQILNEFKEKKLVRDECTSDAKIGITESGLSQSLNETLAEVMGIYENSCDSSPSSFSKFGTAEKIGDFATDVDQEVAKLEGSYKENSPALPSQKDDSVVPSCLTPTAKDFMENGSILIQDIQTFVQDGSERHPIQWPSAADKCTQTDELKGKESAANDVMWGSELAAEKEPLTSVEVQTRDMCCPFCKCVFKPVDDEVGKAPLQEETRAEEIHRGFSVREPVDFSMKERDTMELSNEAAEGGENIVDTTTDVNINQRSKPPTKSLPDTEVKIPRGNTFDVATEKSFPRLKTKDVIEKCTLRINGIQTRSKAAKNCINSE